VRLEPAGTVSAARPELHLFAEWAPATLLDERVSRGRASLADALEHVARRGDERGVALRLHWVWPVLEREVVPLDDYARLLVRLGPFGARLSLWPVIERRRGYFLGPRTAALFAARLAGLGPRLAGLGLAGRVGLTLDLEPPLPWLVGRLRARLDPADRAALDALVARLRSLRDDGALDRLQAAIVPGAVPSPLLDDLIVMAYGSMPDPTHRLERLYPRASAALCTIGALPLRLGARRRVVMALGLLNRGVLQREPTFTRADRFARAVELTRDQGDRELGAYALCGLLVGPEGLVPPDPDLRDGWQPVRPATVRRPAEIDPWLLPLLARVAERRS
jgi:hypothetical protein